MKPLLTRSEVKDWWHASQDYFVDALRAYLFRRLKEAVINFFTHWMIEKPLKKIREIRERNGWVEEGETFDDYLPEGLFDF